MLRLLTLGAVDLRTEDGRSVDSVLAQPKRLALLTYLALRQPAGFHQRNALLAMFWPESDEARARNALRNAIHFLRAELGAETIVSRGNDEIGVSPGELWCDAVVFEKAIKQQRYGEALQLWRGPLLEGFLPSDLPEFTDWLDGRRRGVDWLAADAARAMTERARAANRPNVRAAAQRWVEIAPSDEAAIRALIGDLVLAGQHAEARKTLDTWTARFAREIGAPLSPETAALAAKLRQPSALAQRPDVVSAPVREPSPIGRSIEPQALEPAAEPADAVASPRRNRPRAFGALAVIATLAVVAIAALVRRSRTGSISTAMTSATSVAVLPFSYSGTPQYDYLREAMVDLLSTRIDAVSSLRSVDSRSVLSMAQRAVSHDQAIDPQHGRTIADSFGARYFVLGSVIEVQGNLHLSAALYSSTLGDDAIARTSLSGPVSQLFALSDSAGAVLLHALAAARRVETSASGGAAGAGTTSLPALREFTNGEIAFRQARYADAAAAYRRAAELDPTFARAYFRLSIADSWVGGGAPVKAPLAEAQRNASRLAPDDRLLLAAWNEHIYGRPKAADSLYSAYVAAHPNNAEALFQLGEVRFHWGSGLGIPPSDAATMFRRVLALLPDHAASMTHLIRIAGRAGDSATVASLTRDLLSLGPAEGQRAEARLIAAYTRQAPDTAAIFEIAADASPGTRQTFRDGLLELAASVPNSGQVTDLAARLTEVPAGARLTQYPVGSGLLAAAQGRFHDAMRATHGLPPQLTVLAAELRAMYAALPFSSVSAAEAAKLRDSVRALPTVPANGEVARSLTGGIVFLPRRTFLDALLALRAGDTLAVLRDVGQLERPDTGRAGQFSADYAAILRARLALRSGNAHGGAEALRVLGAPRGEPTFVYPNPLSYGEAIERFTRGEALALVGRDEEAMRWFDGFPDNTGYDIAFVAPAKLAMAHIEERRGHSADARRYTQAAARVWAKADPR